MTRSRKSALAEVRAAIEAIDPRTFDVVADGFSYRVWLDGFEAAKSAALRRIADAERAEPVRRRRRSR